MQISVHLWISGDEKISLASFMILRDISSNLSSDWLDACLKKMYKAFLRHCKSVEPDNLKHIKFLVDSIVEVYSLDIQRPYPNVQSSVQQLANVLKQAIKMKKKVCVNMNMVKILRSQMLSFNVSIITNTVFDLLFVKLRYVMVSVNGLCSFD